jgi:hypothetical protein
VSCAPQVGTAGVFMVFGLLAATLTPRRCPSHRILAKSNRKLAAAFTR